MANEKGKTVETESIEKGEQPNTQSVGLDEELSESDLEETAGGGNYCRDSRSN